ncbi:MAG TPA: four helix bundle protein [Chitinophagaceae bacterium]|nr:four helix bundle protein [Chitinophagaceae bacterium]
MSKESVLKAKSFDFAIRIIKLNQYLREKHSEYQLSQQILRAGTSVGAMVREAEHAESRRDFLHKLNIGLKEINECGYWLDLLSATNYLDKRMYESIRKDCVELLKMLIASIKTTKTKNKTQENYHLSSL